VAVGDRSAVSEETWSLLRRTGTAHLLAISGFHVGIVALVVGLFIRFVSRIVGVVRPVGVPIGWSWGLGAAAGFAYAMAAGGPVSAQRAAWCLAGVAVARVFGRVADPMGLLGCAAVAVLMVDPSAVASAGMQLSFGAVVGILRITPWIVRWVPPDLPWLGRWAIQGMSVTVGATLGTLPAAAWWFQDMAPLSPVANLVAMPVMAFVVVPCASLAVWGPAGSVELASQVGTAALNMLFVMLQPLAVQPLHPAVGPIAAIALVAPLLWPGRPALVIPIVGCALGLREMPKADTVTFLDVGQGDAALIELASGRRLLVDGGPPSDRVLAWLRRRGIRRLDAVVVSHGDADHLGGALPVLAGLRVDALWLADVDGMEEALELARSRGIGVVVHPVGSDGDRNDRSLVFTEAGTLFTGDIGERAERALAPSLAPVAVLKVPHHGSRSSSSQALVNAARPSIAVIGVGRRNMYGHPHPTVVRRYQEHGAEVYRTDLHGSIEVTLRSDHLSIRTFRAGRGWSLPRRLARPAGAEQEDGQGQASEAEGHPLRIAQRLSQQTLQKVATGLVPAEGLQEGSSAGVEHEVQEHHLTIELLPAVEEVHDEPNQKEVGRLVELGGM